MANKTELLARICDLSDQLGRELPTTGTNEVLQSVVDSAEAELALLNEDVSTDVTLNPLPESDNDTPLTTLKTSEDDDEEDDAAYRLVKLRSTLHVVHYVNHKPVCEIVTAGKSIYVDPEEAAALIAENHVYAL